MLEIQTFQPLLFFLHQRTILRRHIDSERREPKRQQQTRNGKPMLQLLVSRGQGTSTKGSSPPKIKSMSQLPSKIKNLMTTYLNSIIETLICHPGLMYGHPVTLIFLWTLHLEIRTLMTTRIISTQKRSALSGMT